MQDNQKDIFLISAIKRYNNDLAKELIAELGINLQIGRHGTPLLMACLHNNTEIALYCLENGAQVNVSDSDKDTPLLLACEKGNLEVAKRLIENGAEINAQNKFDMTPIVKAISRHSDKLDLIEYLLKNGANPFMEEKFKKDHPGRIANNAYELAQYLQKNEVLNLIHKYVTKP